MSTTTAEIVKKNAYIYADSHGYIVSDDRGVIGEVDKPDELDANEYLLRAIEVAKANGCNIAHFSNEADLSDERVAEAVKGFEDLKVAGDW